MKWPKQGEIKVSRRCKAAKKDATSRWFDGRWLCDEVIPPLWGFVFSSLMRRSFTAVPSPHVYCPSLVAPSLSSQGAGEVFFFFVSFLYVTAYSGHSCCPPLTLTLRCLREQPSSSLLSWQAQPFPRPRQQTPGDVSALLPLRRHHPAPSWPPSRLSLETGRRTVGAPNLCPPD